MAAVLKLTDKVDDVRYDAVRDAVERTLSRLEPSGAYYEPDFTPTHVVVVLLDKRDGKYHIKRDTSAMTTSEEIAMLEVAKMNVYEQMRGRM